MSVIAFEPEKFAEVAETMIVNAPEWAWAFGYPDGWQERDTMEMHIRAWAVDLLRSNHATYRRQYGESNQPDIKLPRVAPVNQCRLYKHLRSIRYNCVANDGSKTNLNKAFDILDKVIDHTANVIICELPEYKAASWA